jgi:hypothetical protein
LFSEDAILYSHVRYDRHALHSVSNSQHHQPFWLPLQWHCELNEDGSARDPRYNPDMSLPDGPAKITSFMIWVGDNYPGSEDPKEAAQVVSASNNCNLKFSCLHWLLLLCSACQCASMQVCA